MEEELLTPLEQYLKVGLHIGTKFRTKYMEPFIYKVRPDGLAVMNVKKISERIAVAGKFMAQYEPKDILVVCRRENGWQAAELFAKATGIRVIAGRYKPGALTNPALETFTEAKLIFAVDPWPDRNAILDGFAAGLPVIALCDTNNEATYVDLVVPCNNKGKKSLGLIFWMLAKEYLRNRGLLKEGEELSISLDEFTAD